MTTLAAQFSDALSNIEPDDDVGNAIEAHKEVTKALKADDRLKKLGVDPILIGSYKRHVSIKRIKDVDVFARLTEADETLRPGDILDHVTDVLETAFPNQVERQRRSVKIEFLNFDLSVDIVIARPCVDHPDDHWQIPEKIEDDGNATWVETNPTRMTKLSTEANKEFVLDDGDQKPGIYVPVVKLMRQIRRTCLGDHPGGFYIEVVTLHVFNDLQPDHKTVAGYLTQVLRGVADAMAKIVEEGGLADPTLKGKIISTKATDDEIDAAAVALAEAADLAEKALLEKSTCESAVMWRKLLGVTKNTETEEHVFPLPEYCNPDGTYKTTSSVKPGSSTVPAGDGRYA
ncbi:nucleotidyltransferase [Nocardioides mangrovicus]|uniref:Nucleotidyltransferase n=1 Tax=Nocardioides mangrovicus TaxID=2478913 RepID=A0A3L8P3N4_9ACTN|nr:nucleotidyltransferase [Nocardioides mangrovicus]RLV49724.1 nucleotidyltransferase [Nocardioides mangrovicus]